MLAASQASPDRDAGQGGESVGEAGNGAANGASGFKLVDLTARELLQQHDLTFDLEVCADRRRTGSRLSAAD